MKKITIIFLLMLCIIGCSKIDSKLNQLEKKSAATDIKGAKALYDEAKNFERWIEKKESPSAKQLARARELVQKREKEGLTLLGDKAKDGLSNILGGLSFGNLDSVDFKKVTGWFLGTESPEHKKFGCPEGTDLLKEGAARGCP